MSTATKKPRSDTPQRSKFQTGEIRLIPRSLLKNASYNPRVITPHAKRKLRESLKRFGEFDRLIWNERTGNLIGGHQRLKCLDELEGSPDYSLEVLVVNVDDKTEREMNVIHNNPTIQGQYDMQLLASMLPDIDITRAGFDQIDLDMAFQDAGLPAAMLDSLTPPESKKRIDEATQEIEDLQSESDDIRREEAELDKANSDLSLIKGRRKAYRDGISTENQLGFFVTVVFATNEQKFAFMKHLELDPAEPYANGVILAERFGFDLPQPSTILPEPA